MRLSLVPVLGLATLACAPKTAPVAVGESEAAPPVAPTREHVHTEHEVERSDPWYWLRERENPEVIAYLEAENNWTERQTAHLADARKMLFDEMMSYFKEVGARMPKMNPEADPAVYKAQKEYEQRVQWGPFAGRRALEDDEFHFMCTVAATSRRQAIKAAANDEYFNGPIRVAAA